MTLKRKLILYVFVSSILIIVLYTIMAFLVGLKILEKEAKNEYERILNLYTFSKELNPTIRGSLEYDLQSFERLSFFIKQVNNFELIFIYDISSLKEIIHNFEDFLNNKEIIGSFIIQGDILKNKKLINAAIETETYKIYGNLFNPIFIYVYPINFKGSTIGKAAFIERFSFDIGLVGGIYLFLIAFTLLNIYIPIRFFGNIVEELKYLSKLARAFSQKDFSKIDELRKKIRNTNKRDELYQLKVSILRMVEALEQYIRRLETEVKSYENLAFTDPLTGLYNRRMFIELAKKKLNEIKRYQEPLSLIMLDIDYFKQINDTYGHDAGDIALKFLADILKRNVRASDIVARWGGEEFIILFPKTTLEQAHKVAEKIRRIVERSTIDLPNGGKLKFTVSLGVSSFSGKEDLEELIKEADIALYEAKKRGRNRTEVYRRLLSF